MTNDQIIALLENYLSGTASVEEMERLDTWYDSFDANTSVFTRYTGPELQQASNRMFSAITRTIEKDPDGQCHLKTSV